MSKMYTTTIYYDDSIIINNTSIKDLAATVQHVHISN